MWARERSFSGSHTKWHTGKGLVALSCILAIPVSAADDHNVLPPVQYTLLSAKVAVRPSSGTCSCVNAFYNGVGVLAVSGLQDEVGQSADLHPWCPPPPGQYRCGYSPDFDKSCAAQPTGGVWGKAVYLSSAFPHFLPFSCVNILTFDPLVQSLLLGGG